MLNKNGVEPQYFEIKDWSGGITDNFISSASNRYEKADNLQISDDRTPETRPGLILAEVNSPRPDTLKRINSIFGLNDDLFLVSDLKLYLFTNVFTEIPTAGSNPVFSEGDEFSYYSWVKWNKQLFVTNDALPYLMKIYNDGTNYKASQVGLPIVDVSGVTFTPPGGSPTDKNYLYVVQAYYNYSLYDGSVLEEVGGGSSIIAVDSVAEILVGDGVTLNSLPTIVNGSNTNYEVTLIKFRLYRTTDKGSTFFFAGEYANGVTTFIDDLPDSELVLNDVFYATDDIPDHEAPPQGKYIHSVLSYLIMGNVSEGGVLKPNRVRFSNKFMPYSFPGSFYMDFNEEVTGVTSVVSTPIIFCRNSTHRINGSYNADGSDNIQKVVISNTIGCISDRSIVQTNEGVFWAGNDGFYFCDGNNVRRISGSLNETYKRLTSTIGQKDSIYGAYNPVENKIVWAVKQITSNDTNETIFVLHLNLPLGTEMCFTTWSGGAIYPFNFAPVSVYYNAGILYHGDVRGYLLKYDVAALSDDKIDTTEAAATLWKKNTILYDHITAAFDFGSSAGRKWVPWIVVNADNVSSISLLVSSNNDHTGDYRPLAIIKYKGNIEWGDYDIVWGDPSIRWNYFPVISAKRRFPANSLRCSYKQVRFQNAYVDIETSETLGPGVFSTALATMTLVDTLKVLPKDIIDYYLTCSKDNFEARYLIVGRPNDYTVQVDDNIGAAFPDGTFEWKIKGFRRDEVLSIISYTVNYSFTSQTQQTYKGET